MTATPDSLRHIASIDRIRIRADVRQMTLTDSQFHCSMLLQDQARMQSHSVQQMPDRPGMASTIRQVKPFLSRSSFGLSRYMNILKQGGSLQQPQAQGIIWRTVSYSYPFSSPLQSSKQSFIGLSRLSSTGGQPTGGAPDGVFGRGSAGSPRLLINLHPAFNKWELSLFVRMLADRSNEHAP